MEQSRVRMGAETALYQGQIVALRGPQLVAALHSAKRQLRLGITLNVLRGGIVTGSVHGTRISATIRLTAFATPPATARLGPRDPHRRMECRCD